MQKLPTLKSIGKTLFKRVIPGFILASGLVGSCAYFSFKPETLDIDPEKCKTAASRIWDSNSFDESLKETRKMYGCFDVHTMENLLAQRVPHAFNPGYLECLRVEYLDRKAVPDPKILPTLIDYVQQRPGLNLDNPIFEILSHFKSAEVAEVLLSNYFTRFNNSNLIDTDFLGNPKIDEKGFIDYEVYSGARNIVNYARDLYPTFENPITEQLRNAVKTFPKKGQKALAVRALVTEYLSYVKSPDNYHFKLSLVRSENGKMVQFSELGACEFQPNAEHAFNIIPKAVTKLANEKVGNDTRNHLEPLETLIVMQNQDWSRVFPNVSGFMYGGVAQQFSNNVSREYSEFQTNVHEMVHYLAHGEKGKRLPYLDAPIVFEWLTEIITRKIILNEIGVDSKVNPEWHGQYLSKGYNKIVDDPEFLRLYEVFERRLGFESVVSAYLNADLNPLRMAMDDEYGPGSFDEVFNYGHRVGNLNWYSTYTGSETLAEKERLMVVTGFNNKEN